MSTHHTGHQPGQPPAPTVWPCLHCTSAPTVIDWLVSALGFVESARHTEGDSVVHAELLWPEGGGVMLGDRDRGADDPHTTAAGSSVNFLVTADSDAVYERARAAGAEVVMEMHDTDYGDHGFSVRDPEGNVWSVGQYPGQPAPEGR
jgi:uncharacterized glyoxalase superfamily protein PhnB